MYYGRQPATKSYTMYGIAVIILEKFKRVFKMMVELVVTAFWENGNAGHSGSF